MSDDAEREERLAWFRAAKLGLFVHWGHYATLAHGEQILNRDMMPLDEYEPNAATFKPAADWAPKLAKQAKQMGARYVALTTRHHDGYCLFDTKTHDYNAVQTGPGRDLVREFVDAMRAEGLKIGLYYSVVNWRWQAYWDPQTYADDLPKIVDEMHQQVEELMTNYGQVDVLWYDVPAVPGARSPGSWGHVAEPVEQSPAEFYRSAALNARVRELQPQILINNRSGLPEDFGTPEQHITPEKDGRMFEACMTLNPAPGWGYLHEALALKSFGEVMHNLVNAVRLGGNYLFNVGPDGDGYVREPQLGVLQQIGRWMDVHGDAVHGTTPGRVYGGANQGANYHYGMITTRENIAWLTLFYYPGPELVISRLGPAIKSATLLTTGAALTVEPMRNARWKITGLPEHAPELSPPVVKIEFDGPPHLLRYTGADWLDGTMTPLPSSS